MLDNYSSLLQRRTSASHANIFKHVFPAIYKMLSSLQCVNTINHSAFRVIRLQKLTFSRISLCQCIFDLICYINQKSEIKRLDRTEDKNKGARTSLVVQWLRLWVYCRGHSFSPWSGNENPTCQRPKKRCRVYHWMMTLLPCRNY